MNVIFDLDGTVIDSSHRHLSNADGSVDLVHWRENCTPEKIAADKLLPLAKAMRAIHASGAHIVICTARVFTFADLQFLEDNNLPYHGLLTRTEGDTRKDCEMKVSLLTEYFMRQGYSSLRAANAIMFDDNLNVLRALSVAGVTCFDATKENFRRAA